MFDLEVLLLALGVACALACGVPTGGAGRLSRRWVFVMRDLTDPEQVKRTMGLVPRAAAAGCNAMVLSDRAFQRLATLSASEREEYRRLQAELRGHGMDLIPTVMVMGYGRSLLRHDANLAEGLPVRDALFVAEKGRAVHRPDPMVTLADGGFEAADGHRFVAWEGQDDAGRSIFADHAVVHGGRTAVRMEDFPPAAEDEPQSRLWQTVQVSPFRQYHLSVWARTEELEAPSGTVTICVRSVRDPKRQLNFSSFPFAGTKGWAQYHVMFNSLDDAAVRVYVGTWGARSGRVWWDDLDLEEVALVNVLRRAGCPLSVRGENDMVYEEERDFERVHDPRLNPDEIYHEPPGIRLTPETRIGEGERLRVSYHHPAVVWRSQVVNCLGDPLVYELLEEEIRRVEELLRPGAFFMQHDEIRVANWDAACQGRGLTPGGLLAENMRRCVEIIRGVRSDAEMWVWSDMFDPSHNAGPGFPERDGPFYLANGSFSGSWDGLPSEVGIVNWDARFMCENLNWFSGRGHEQILAGYYDHDGDGAQIARWVASAGGVPGVTGAMYTTWADGYDALEAWAARAWGGDA
jgi:hypothetical protein